MSIGKDDARKFGRALAALTVLAAVLAVLFRVLPAVDLQVSRGFYSPGSGFAFAEVPAWDAVVTANKLASILFVGTALVFLPVALLRRQHLWLRYWGFVIMLYLLGPGLLVNVTLKRLIGRARPTQIAEFGGDGGFTAAWQLSDYCRSACSFVSAETAVATALMVSLAVGAVWFAGRPVARWFIGLACASLGLLVLTALQRLGSGRHYLSDVIFAALLVAILALLLAGALHPRRQATSKTRTSGLAR